MKEIELKFIIKNPAEMRRRFLKLGARKIWSGREKNIFFDTKDRAIYKKRSMLRLKTIGFSLLTYKKLRSQKRYKVAEEIQVKFDAKEQGALEQILRLLGFIPVFAYSKRREFWDAKIRGKEVHFTLDTILGKNFIEIEASPALIRLVAKRLGLDTKKGLTITYASLLGKGHIGI
jgi:predicted adenylyl cyclase CyaB